MSSSAGAGAFHHHRVVWFYEEEREKEKHERASKNTILHKIKTVWCFIQCHALLPHIVKTVVVIRGFSLEKYRKEKSLLALAPVSRDYNWCAVLGLVLKNNWGSWNSITVRAHVPLGYVNCSIYEHQPNGECHIALVITGRVDSTFFASGATNYTLLYCRYNIDFKWVMNVVWCHLIASPMAMTRSKSPLGFRRQLHGTSIVFSSSQYIGLNISASKLEGWI